MLPGLECVSMRSVSLVSAVHRGMLFRLQRTFSWNYMSISLSKFNIWQFYHDYFFHIRKIIISYWSRRVNCFDQLEIFLAAITLF